MLQPLQCNLRVMGMQVLMELHVHKLPLYTQQFPGTPADTLEHFFTRMW